MRFYATTHIYTHFSISQMNRPSAHELTCLLYSCMCVHTDPLYTVVHALISTCSANFGVPIQHQTYSSYLSQTNIHANTPPPSTNDSDAFSQKSWILSCGSLRSCSRGASTSLTSNRVWIRLCVCAWNEIIACLAGVQSVKMVMRHN